MGEKKWQYFLKETCYENSSCFTLKKVKKKPILGDAGNIRNMPKM
jgi:hypothetical protein